MSTGGVTSTRIGGSWSTCGSISSASEGRPSGPGTSRARVVCEMGVASGRWNDADIAKVTLPCWWASTRRTLNPRPSRIRSTWNSTGWVGSPGRRKYACRECT